MNPFSVPFTLSCLNPGLYPGLELANTFGVLYLSIHYQRAMGLFLLVIVCPTNNPAAVVS